ncbi:hypothetical protein CEXT_553571 [Caerostris extrusa]|uniref:Uncharacterized protein n=1 Tax=Caerostris extrusa TaxID=172846 RepID=A0AAV4NR56_CAEEX|nr:hypothetical protein CEXT_553571 [Caerostris extrusa]
MAASLVKQWLAACTDGHSGTAIKQPLEIEMKMVQIHSAAALSEDSEFDCPAFIRKQTMTQLYCCWHCILPRLWL